MLKVLLFTEEEVKETEARIKELENEIKALKKELKQKQGQINYLAEFKRQVEMMQWKFISAQKY